MIKGRWWCDNCKRTVKPEEVTYEEVHCVKSGGCGFMVVWRPNKILPLINHWSDWQSEKSKGVQAT